MLSQAGHPTPRQKVYMQSLWPQPWQFSVCRLDETRDQGDVVTVVLLRCNASRDAYARKAKRPAATVPTRPSLTEREPAALSLSRDSSSSEPDLPPLPVELAPEEEVVFEPEPEPEALAEPAGAVPLF